MASTRDIRTNQVDISCDVCGRTLLRGERAESYLAGGERRQVCELCTVRAQHEGWIREDGGEELTLCASRTERGRGFFEKLRARRERAREVAEESEAAAGMTEVKAEVPMSELLTYAPDLRSITGGQGEYTLEFLRYEEVPAHLAQKIVQKAAGEEEAVKA